MNNVEKVKSTMPLKKKILLCFIVLVLMAGTFIAAYFLFYKGNTGLEIDDNATTGIMPGIDEAQRRKELQDTLDRGMIAFSINTSPEFEKGTSEGNIMIENPGNNAKLLVIEIKKDDTKETLYTSKAIRPGSYLEKIKLDKILEKGVYPATVHFKAYTEDSNEYIGETGAGITITVKS